MRISDWSSDVCSSDLAGIAWHEKTLGQLFCDGASQQIIDMLLADCAAAAVTLMAETTVSQVQKRGERFHLTTSRGAVEGESLVVATGGPSIPKLGASGYAYDLARQFGVAVVLPRPALDVGLARGGERVGLYVGS